MIHEETAKAIFDRHYAYYSDVGIETIKQQAGQAEQVSNDYEGRVIYELLQNAFDKAESKVLVKVERDTLYVANDGERFTYMQGYDYKDGKSKRADFQSLCSISTSTKNANTSIGNKGVGFKSVFSIAKDRMVEVHTKCLLLDENREHIEADINFRIHESFKDVSQIPSNLPDDVRTKLEEQILAVQKERVDRGVPGYYYPEQLIVESNQESAIPDGYVTLIKISLEEKGVKECERLFKEIESLHFRFVALRVKTKITVEFEFEGESQITFQRQIDPENEDGRLVRFELGEKLNELAKAAGIQVEAPVVAIYLRKVSEGPGYLYNYLPTNEKSPFTYIDFHADFHTTVDRRSINFQGDIGAYNQALMRACIELLFAYLGSYSEKNQSRSFNARYVSPDALPIRLRTFDWNHLAVQEKYKAFHHVQSMFDIWNYHYWKQVKWLANIAEDYFAMKARPRKMHELFFEHAGCFAKDFAWSQGQDLKWVSIFLQQLAMGLIDQGVKVLPNETKGEVGIAAGSEIYIRESRAENRSYFVPDFLGIAVTSFPVKNDDFRKALNLKEFRERAEILKHFRQVSPKGEFHSVKDHYTEPQQLELLSSIASFLNVQDQNRLCTHRFDGFDSNTTISDNVQTNFALSTIFLKTTKGRFKPSQLCLYKELDLDFLPPELDDFGREHLLKLLGVSFHPTYRFVDEAINQKKLKSGLAYIPAPWKKPHENADALRNDAILSGIRVVMKNESVHPALLNNNYRFLKHIAEAGIRGELGHLGWMNYEKWPRPYLQVLVEEMKKNRHRFEEMIRLYEKIANPLRKLNLYLVICQNKLSLTTNTDFLVAKNVYEFEILRGTNFTFLAIYRGTEKMEWASAKMVQFQEGDVLCKEVVENPVGIRELFFEKLPFLLVAISKSDQFRRDFLNNKRDIEELRERLLGLKFFECDSLQRALSINGDRSQIMQRRSYAYVSEKRRMYFERGIGYRRKAEAIAKFLLDASTFVSDVELIIFRKELHELRKEYSKEEVSTVKKAWDPNFERKWAQFQQRIFELAGIQERPHDERWYVHSNDHPSEWLCAHRHQLTELKAAIDQAKTEFNEYFWDFSLQIDHHSFDERIVTLTTRIDTLPENERQSIADRLAKLSRQLILPSELDQLEREFEDRTPAPPKGPNVDRELSSKVLAEIHKDRDLEEIRLRLKHKPSLLPTEFLWDQEAKAVPIGIEENKRLRKSL